MKEELLAIVEELKRLKRAGVTHVSLSDETLVQLTQSVAEPLSRQAVAKETVVASIPERIRSASPEEFDEILKESPKAKTPARSSSPRQTFGPPPKVTLAEGTKRERWEALRQTVLDCTVCNEQVREGYQVVFGVGDIDAEVFFCGEAPGAEEEEQGEPFVGRAGQLLDKMIQAMGLEREQVYIGNIMNWRPRLPTRVGNRPPKPEEIAFCLPYLQAQVEVVQPKVIVALGATAAKGLLGSDSFRSLREVKGMWQDFKGVPVLPTYHPSYLLRNNDKRDKRSAWTDLLKVMERIDLPISDRQRAFFQ